MIREIEFSAKLLWGLRGSFPEQPFAAVDPGTDGAVVVYDRIGLTSDGLIERPCKVFPLTVSLDVIARELVNSGVKLLFVEAQYQGVNPSTTIKLVRRAGYLPAFLAGMWQPEDVTVMWVQPATWQSIVKKWAAIEGRRLKKGEAKKLAMALATQIFNGDGRFVGANKAQRQGIADAEAIAVWAMRAMWMAREPEVLTA